MSFSTRSPAPGQLEVLLNDRPLFVLNFNPDSPTPYLHPVYSPSGRILTADTAGTRGIELAWPDVNGVRFGIEGRIGENFGQVVTPGPVAVAVDLEPQQVTLRGQHLWQDSSGKTLMEENRSITAFAPEEEGWQLLDWMSQFQPTGEAVTLLAEDGPLGLNYHAAADMAGGKRINSRNQEGSATDGGAAEWCAYSGPAHNGTKAAGIAIMAGRRNPFPRPDFSTQSEPVGRLSTGLPRQTPYLLSPGKVLALRYRIALYDGAADFIALQMQYTTFMWN